MRNVFTYVAFSLSAATSVAQPDPYSERKLARAVFERDEIKAIAYYDKQLGSGDSSRMSDYASALFRAHETDRSYELFKAAHQKKQITSVSHASEFLQVTHIFDTLVANAIDSEYQELMLTAGYKEIPLKRSHFRYAVAELACYNSDADDFGVCESDHAFVFASTRQGIDENIESSIVRPFRLAAKDDCAASAIREEAGWMRLIEKLDPKFNLGPVHCSRDERHVFVSVNRSKPNRQGIYCLMILESHQDSMGYSKLSPLPFDQEGYSFQHPYFDARNKCLYFSSNMPGGMGGYDLYRVKYDGSAWGRPENISSVNTAATEAFPFADANGNLYYSGRSVKGFGGLDLMMLGNGKTAPVLLEAPLNSAWDDFGIVMTDSLHGYFCSNRKAAKAGDNIYTYRIDLPPYRLTLKVKDEQTQAGLRDVVMKIRYEDTLIAGISDERGEFVVMLPGSFEGRNLKPAITYSRSDYAPVVFSPAIVLGEDRSIAVAQLIRRQEVRHVVVEKPVEVSKVVEKIKVGVDLGKLLKLNPIYFDLQKSSISAQAAFELDKIVGAMIELPGLVIELGAHTDSRGQAKANQELSQKRAEAAAQYILAKGIDPTRITWQGYGESKPLNKCKDGVKCAEKDYAINRRTEFRIVKM